MKRILCLISILCMISLATSGCSLFLRPTNISKTCYSVGINVLEITDKYIDGKITAVDAAGQIQDQCTILDALPEQKGTEDQNVKNYCNILSHTFMLLSEDNHQEEENLIPNRNFLATLLGKPMKE